MELEMNVCKNSSKELGKKYAINVPGNQERKYVREAAGNRQESMLESKEEFCQESMQQTGKPLERNICREYQRTGQKVYKKSHEPGKKV